MKDFYKVLNVSKNASWEEMKKARNAFSDGEGSGSETEDGNRSGIVARSQRVNLQEKGSFEVIVSDISREEARALIKSKKINLTSIQAKVILKCLTGAGRVDEVKIKLNPATGAARLFCKRSGHISGYQTLAFEFDSDGYKSKVVQTACHDDGTRVEQRPGEKKNNIFDVKKWKPKK